MANGDAAAAAGMDVVSALADKRLGYDEINKSRDYIAGEITTPRPVNRGGTGATTAAGARTNLGITATNVPSNGTNVQADIDFINGKADTAQSTANSAAGGANLARSGDFDIAVWNRNITWTRQAAWIGNDGTIKLGYSPSTRASKQDIAEPEWSIDQLRAIPILHYRYIAEVAKQAADPSYHVGTELGSIADELHALGLWEFVIYEGHGVDATPRGIHYELLGLAALWLAQRAHDRIDHLERELTTLKGGA